MSRTRQHARSRARSPTYGDQERPGAGARGRGHTERDFRGHKVDESIFSRVLLVLLKYPYCTLHLSQYVIK